MARARRTHSMPLLAAVIVGVLTFMYALPPTAVQAAHHELHVAVGDGAAQRLAAFETRGSSSSGSVNDALGDSAMIGDSNSYTASGDTFVTLAASVAPRFTMRAFAPSYAFIGRNVDSEMLFEYEFGGEFTTSLEQTRYFDVGSFFGPFAAPFSFDNFVDAGSVLTQNRMFGLGGMAQAESSSYPTTFRATHDASIIFKLVNSDNCPGGYLDSCLEMRVSTPDHHMNEARYSIEFSSNVQIGSKVKLDYSVAHVSTDEDDPSVFKVNAIGCKNPDCSLLGGVVYDVSKTPSGTMVIDCSNENGGNSVNEENYYGFRLGFFTSPCSYRAPGCIVYIDNVGFPDYAGSTVRIGVETGCNDGTDVDSDGVCDDEDLCALDALKTAPGLCGCGEVDVDSDSDGSCDTNGDDDCPSDGDKTSPGVCGCGVVDADADSDGSCDTNGDDQCPSDALKTEPGVCGCDNAEDTADDDSDGVENCNDPCPADIADDSDSDGACDSDELCPLDPLKTEPGVCGCGAADIDENANGICDTDEVSCPEGLTGSSCQRGEIVLQPTGDTFTSKSSTDKNYSSNKYLLVAKNRHSMLTFNVPCSSLTYIHSATLSMYAYVVDSVELHTVHWSPTGFDATQVTWNNPPLVDKWRKISSYEPTLDTWMRVDVSEVVHDAMFLDGGALNSVPSEASGGTTVCPITFRVKGSDSDKVRYYSSEKSGFEPYLSLDIETLVEQSQLLLVDADVMVKENAADAEVTTLKKNTVAKNKWLLVQFPTAALASSCDLYVFDAQLELYGELVEPGVTGNLVHVYGEGEGAIVETEGSAPTYNSLAASGDNDSLEKIGEFSPVVGQQSVTLSDPNHWLMHNCVAEDSAGWVTLRVKGRESSVSKYYSKEKNAGEYGPYLSVTYAVKHP